MLLLWFSKLGLLLLCSTLVAARTRDGRMNGNVRPIPGVPRIEVLEGPVTSRNGTTIPPYNTTYYFQQLIDHNNPSAGTFTQRYWHTWEFYEKGGPIILMTPWVFIDHLAADGYYGYLTNRTINGLIAQQSNGATIVLEHRFYGLSNPRPDLSVKSLQLHTIAQAIQDLKYFAENVDLPMPGGNAVKPDTTPWILAGGSYAGALTSFTKATIDTFFIGYASSAVVQNIVDFWGYFEPIRQNMPKNCSADVQAAITHIDKVLTAGSNSSIQSLKATFGLEAVKHNDDAAGALRNNLWDWQALQPDSGPGTQFTEFCDALEVKNGKNAPASGWGTSHAISAWGSYFKNTYLPLVCGDDDRDDCLGTYNTSQSYWTDTSINNSGRSWQWIVCNEVGFFQDSAPVGTPSLVSRLIQPAYDSRQCQQMFPKAFRKPPVPNVAKTNALYKGWNVTEPRLFFATGSRDPWREATKSADNTDFKSTTAQPIAESDGFHCSDLLTSEGQADATIAAVQQKALASIKVWLTEWPSHKKGKRDAVSPKAASSKPINAWMKSFGSA
ncbi:hypothetical protein PUNSTDRAFT_132850 [Punctularia strigosozonata HHB-11173 SS5]|uniref:uncharacterized protein n=1 Tax=Punctularia strigosozonata (strain HHB-11173) TaxID=741275 RepID=UPI000441680A|nr:uncharacterized protein PUNSTDRAFT_132850 [Punctularia strigosozonata HHB-11173 SS5]EIN10777.1 hypothetical protein PUNSTDRAFT_132850 [Punctularia strigosozonata HHB-11173 SS5]